MASRGIGTHIKRLLGDAQANVLEDTPEESLFEEAGSSPGIEASPTKTHVRRRQAFAVTAERGIPAERLLLNRLGVFFDGCTLEAAVAVCGGDGIAAQEVGNLLARLADASLITVEEKGSERRYRLPDEAQARLRFSETAEAPTLRRRHRDYFMRWAADACRNLSSASSAKAEKPLPENANLWAALLWSQQQKESQAVLFLAQALPKLGSARG